MDDLFSRSAIKAEGKEHLRKHLDSAIWLIVLSAFLSWVANRVVSALFGSGVPKIDWQAHPIAEVITLAAKGTFTANNLFSLLVQNLVAAAIVLAGVYFYLSVTRTSEKLSLSNPIIFGFTHSPKAYLLNFLVGIVIAIGYILFIVPGIILGIKYMFAFYVLADHPEYSVMQAFHRSDELTAGHKMDLFLYNLSFFPWILLIVVTLGLAAFYVGPYISTSTAVYYNRLVYNDEGILPDAPGAI